VRLSIAAIGTTADLIAAALRGFRFGTMCQNSGWPGQMLQELFSRSGISWNRC
jgi:hypothetical protein